MNWQGFWRCPGLRRCINSRCRFSWLSRRFTAPLCQWGLQMSCVGVAWEPGQSHSLRIVLYAKQCCAPYCFLCISSEICKSSPSFLLFSEVKNSSWMWCVAVWRVDQRCRVCCWLSLFKATRRKNTPLCVELSLIQEKVTQRWATTKNSKVWLQFFFFCFFFSFNKPDDFFMSSWKNSQRLRAPFRGPE